jgi:hypothetical protein
MNKKLTRFDIFIVLSFLLLLVVAIASFFFGFQTGKDQAEEKYRLMMTESSEDKKQEKDAYQQQQLVSFYHNILLPFREFQLFWFEKLDEIKIGGDNSSQKTSLREISKLASEKSKKIKPATFPASFPLLVDSQSNYLKSLTLFSEAVNRLEVNENPDIIVNSMTTDPYVLEATKFALLAQDQFYEAIWRWSNNNKQGKLNTTFIGKENLKIETWRSLNLNEKNVFIAKKLNKMETFVPFYPQDISSRIDDLDLNQQLNKLKLTDVSSTLNMLLSTGGVRNDDFLRSKDKLYRNETLPQLPFFIK